MGKFGCHLWMTHDREVPPRKSCSAGVKNEIPSRKQSSRSPENHDDLKTNKLRSTIPLMDLLPPSLDPHSYLPIYECVSQWKIWPPILHKKILGKLKLCKFQKGISGYIGQWPLWISHFMINPNLLYQNLWDLFGYKQDLIPKIVWEYCRVQNANFCSADPRA